MKENNLMKFVIAALLVAAIIILALSIALFLAKPKSSLDSTTEDPNSNQPVGVIISSESLLEDE